MAKATEPQKPRIRVYFVQGRPGFSAKLQRSLGGLDAMPGIKIYEPNGKNDETVAEAVRAARGSPVGVIGGFRPFGETRKAMIAGYKQAKAAKGVIVDPLTGMSSDRDSAEMLDNALNRVHRELVEPSEGYAAVGRRGAERRWKKIHHERVSLEVAKKAWFDHEQFNTDMQVSTFLGLGWSLGTLRKEFKKSGRRPGRRKAKTGGALAPSKVTMQQARK